MTSIIHGTPISPGLEEGPIHAHRYLLGPIDAPDCIEQGGVEAEFSRLDLATTRILDDLLALATRVEEEIDSKLAGIFGAHRLMATDISLKDELRREIADNWVNASSAVKTVLLRWEKRFLSMESQISRDKGDDVSEVPPAWLPARAGNPDRESATRSKARRLENDVYR